MATVGYVRVSTKEQGVEAQQHKLAQKFNIEKWFADNGVSGTVKAKERPGFSALLDYIREGDTLVVPAIDRLGRNTIDVLETVEAFKAKGVKVVSRRRWVRRC